MSVQDQRSVDEEAVRGVSAVMAAHMAMARMGPYHKEGWQDKQLCDSAALSAMFFRALKRQRLISAMNYLMMLWFRGDNLALNEVAPIIPARPQDETGMVLYQVDNVYALIDAQDIRISELVQRLEELEQSNGS